MFQFISATVDLSTATSKDCQEILDNFAKASAGPPCQALLFHNAASLGAIKYAKHIDDSANLTSYFHLNVR